MKSASVEGGATSMLLLFIRAEYRIGSSGGGLVTVKSTLEEGVAVGMLLPFVLALGNKGSYQSSLYLKRSFRYNTWDVDTR